MVLAIQHSVTAGTETKQPATGIDGTTTNGYPAAGDAARPVDK